MLEQVMTYIHNWFIRDVYQGKWDIVDGSLAIPGIKDGQYFRVLGSVFSDGLHQWPSTFEKDEEFRGEIWLLAVPPAFIDLVNEIEAWQEKNGEAMDSPYASESFGGYSYTKASDVSGAGNTDPANGWQRQFMARLIPWRKLS